MDNHKMMLQILNDIERRSVALGPAGQKIKQCVNAARAMQMQEPALYGISGSYWRRMPDRYLRVPGMAAQAANTTSGAYPITWPCRCRVVGMMVGTVENTVQAMGSLSVRVTIQGQFELITTGQQAGFMPIGLGNVSHANSNVGWIPLDWQVEQATEVWQLYVQNESAAAGPFTPQVAFAFCDEE